MIWLLFSLLYIVLNDASSPARTTDFNPCEMERGTGGNGRYPRFISEAFPHGVVRPMGELRNLFCRCVTPNWMICTIHVVRGTGTERRVRAKLNRADEAAMRPFFIHRYVQMSDPLTRHPIVFAHPYCMPVIYAQIEVQVEDNIEQQQILVQPPLRRIDSAPARLQNPPKLIAMSQCTQRRCPITLERLRPGTDVFILKSTIPDLQLAKKVPCISGEGLRQAALSADRGTFMDPLRRENQETLNIHDDYTQYVLYDDSTDPVCPLTPSEVQSEDSPSGQSESGGDFSTPQQGSSAGEGSSSNGRGSTGMSISPVQQGTLHSPGDSIETPPTNPMRTLQLHDLQLHTTPSSSPTASSDFADDERVASQILPSTSSLFFVVSSIILIIFCCFPRKASLHEVYLEFTDDFEFMT